LPDVAAWALGREPGDGPALPRIAEPGQVVGRTPSGALLAAGTGDNMAAALGLGLADGEVAVSIGTSGTVFCVSDQPSADPGGFIAGFADATGRYLPLVCTVNASKVLAVTAGLLGVGHEEFAELALASTAGAGGLTFLPYLDGERTPNRPQATGVIRGLTSTTSRSDLARAAVEALLCSLADAVDALGVTPQRVLMIGGAARNPAVQQLAPAIFGMDVVVPAAAEYVALGAARQAAWALSGSVQPPQWPAAAAQTFTAPAAPGVGARYDALRDATTQW
jgi:xylulokinase